MTYEQVKQDEAVRVYIDQADASLKALGFTEHSFQHVTRVAQTAGWILESLGYPERTVELVKIRRISPRYRQRCEPGRSQPERRGDGVPHP